MKSKLDFRCKSLAATIAVLSPPISLAQPVCDPPPPTVYYDARLSMVVTPDELGPLVPGTSGRIDFTVELSSSSSSAAIPLQIRTPTFADPPQYLPPGALQLIRFTAAQDNTCPFYEQLVTGPSFSTYFYSLAAGSILQAGQRQCSVRFEVFPAAGTVRTLKFEVSQFDYSSCTPHRDLNLADNTVAFAYGGTAAPQAVPTGGRVGWWTMAVALAALAIGSAFFRRRKSRRS